ncbi:MAG: 16S rRNA (uracil(1498)-N(3))-methyltransferase [Clostridiales Family XIII bacterium]|jgi:16S rRNA (uracil1498-N3)-methyltransferase|nr:16S rRNA (uracil(1498)-N(3))-methyltransferase [Clostridiales Family XIII bacterium]
MSRFFVEENQISGNEIRIVSKRDVKHLTRVLRAARGDRVEVSDSAEWEYETEFLRTEDGVAVLRILDRQRFAREPGVRVALFQGLPKAAKMDAIIQKSVELGVDAIFPVACVRSIAAGDAVSAHKLARWQKISDEAAKQCRRGLAPKVHPVLPFDAAVSAMRGFALMLFPYENETERSLKSCLRGLSEKPADVALIIGPEGGFAREEAEALTLAGAVSVSLGGTVLRTETAGPAALAMILYEFEQV